MSPQYDLYEIAKVSVWLHHALQADCPMSEGMGAATPIDGTDCHSLISIVIPVKRIGRDELARLASIAQGAPLVQLIVVGKLLTGVVDGPKNLKLVDEDRRLYSAMNLGAELAQTTYLLFMGIDDVLLADNVAPLISQLRNVPQTPLVVLPFFVGRRLVKQIPKPGRLSPFHHQGVLFRRDILLQLGGYSSDYTLHSDLDLMLRMQKAGSPAAIDMPLVRFSKGGMSTSGQHAHVSIAEFFSIYKRNRVTRLDGSFLFSVSLLLWYRIRFLALRCLRA